MTEDSREDILVYVLALLTNLSGVVSVWRNRRNLPEKDEDGNSLRPAIIMLDGDQRVVQSSAQIMATKAVRMMGVHVCINPEIFIVLDMPDTPENNTLHGNAYDPGAELSDWCSKITGVIENDDGLIDLLTPNGQIAYLGFDTDMKTASTIGSIGPMGRVRYDFYYPRLPPRS